MNRIDFQQIAELRIREAKALLNAGFADGAYYLAGYAVECALKACIARRTQEHDFPEKSAGKYYSHDLEDLLGFAKLKADLEQAISASPAMKANWAILQNWSEESRYEIGKPEQQARDLLTAIEDQTGGLLQWLQQRW
ncbi:MAG TPA: HEPN domain-containing protein [Terracidiphilus sp.]|jgi:HEPN domain-containing protein|nr:HEPN domain-containing protein [Terracidiphilus sp.]